MPRFARSPRVATFQEEERLLAMGRAGTAEHVERILRGWRRMDLKEEVRGATRAGARRWRSTTASIPVPRASAPRSSSTSMRQFWRTRRRLANPSSSGLHP